MSIDDDRDLSAVFEELTAPRSTADYANRVPSLEIRTTTTRWPQALAAAVAVLVAVGGAGTFLALRAERQNGGTAGTAGNPPARTGAAMAYDSTTGTTVMFGGLGSSGKVLTDTWTWDGVAWKSAAGGPGRLVDVRMVDDPAEHGVLLVGMPAPPADAGSISSGSGCAVAGGVTGGSSGSAGGGTPAAVTGPAAPAVASAPPAGTPVPPGTTSVPPPSTLPGPTCTPSTVPAPTEQTWLFSAQGWNLASVSSTASSPPFGAQLTFDPTTQQVLAVSSNFFSCGPPLMAPAGSSAAIACPVTEGSSAPNASTPVHCALQATCAPNSTIETWAWNGGYWTQEKSATVQANGVTLLFDDPSTKHATLMAQSGLGGYGAGAYPCPIKQTPPVCSGTPTPPQVTTWTWTGATWDWVSQVPNHDAAPMLGGAGVAAIGGRILVLTTTGETWIWAAGHWMKVTVAGGPSARSGAAMADGPSSTLVLFGGGPASSVMMLSSSPGSLGSDTWVWDGSAWKHAGGSAPSMPATPSCPALKDGSIPPCVEPQPAQVPPATPAPTATIPRPSSVQSPVGPPATP